MANATVVSAGVMLVLVGFLVVAAGILASTKSGETTVRGGGVVFLGPIPIIFGSDRTSAVAVSVLALALMAVAFLLSRR